MLKSPGGSTFPYYYKGGEIHALKYGSRSDEDQLIGIMHEEVAFMAKRNQKYRVWIDFYETVITDHVLEVFLETIKQMEPQLYKLAPAGLSNKDERRLKRRLKGHIDVPTRYFSDPEDAKTWLVAAND